MFLVSKLTHFLNKSIPFASQPTTLAKVFFLQSVLHLLCTDRDQYLPTRVKSDPQHSLQIERQNPLNLEKAPFYSLLLLHKRRGDR